MARAQTRLACGEPVCFQGSRARWHARGQYVSLARAGAAAGRGSGGADTSFRNAPATGARPRYGQTAASANYDAPIMHMSERYFCAVALVCAALQRPLTEPTEPARGSAEKLGGRYRPSPLGRCRTEAWSPEAESGSRELCPRHSPGRGWGLGGRPSSYPRVFKPAGPTRQAAGGEGDRDTISDKRRSYRVFSQSTESPGSILRQSSLDVIVQIRLITTPYHDSRIVLRFFSTFGV